MFVPTLVTRAPPDEATVVLAVMTAWLYSWRQCGAASLVAVKKLMARLLLHYCSCLFAPICCKSVRA